MRRGRSWAVLAILVVSGCATSAPTREMVGYVPPTSLPAQPKRTIVQAPPAQVWNQLVAFLGHSEFQIDHTDPENRLIIARYSGNPESFIDCGSIVTHENGELGQIPGATESVNLNYNTNEQPIVLKRFLNLDGRIIIRLSEQNLGTVVSTDTTYVVTKVVDVEKPVSGIIEGSRETVSFSAGKRAAFSKGTACQSNGALDGAILSKLPNVLGSKEIARADLPVEQPERNLVDGLVDEQLDAAVVPKSEDIVAEGTSETDDKAAKADSTEPKRSAALAAIPSATEKTPPPPQARVQGLRDVPAKTSSKGKAAFRDINDGAGPAPSLVTETTSTLLATLDCPGKEWHFCEMIELTAPYRELNVERALGLNVDVSDRFAPKEPGSELQLDVDLPNYPSYLHIIYARRDGKVDHILSSFSPMPAGVTHHFTGSDYIIPNASGLALITAITSEQPLFPPGRLGQEEADSFLRGLEQQLASLETSAATSRMAASQLLINVE